MKRVFSVLVIMVLIGLGLTVDAYAGVWEKTRGWLSQEFFALIASALLALLGSALGLLFRKISLTFREAGEFMTILGTAIEDNRLTRDELAAIIREGKDIFTVWK